MATTRQAPFASARVVAVRSPAAIATTVPASAVPETTALARGTSAPFAGVATASSGADVSTVNVQSRVTVRANTLPVENRTWTR